MKKAFKLIVVAAISMAAIFAVSSCQKTETGGKSALGNLAKTVWDCADDDSGVIVFGEGNQLFFVEELGNNKFSSQEGTFVYNNPEVTLKMGNEAIIGSVAADGKSMTFKRGGKEIKLDIYTSVLETLGGTKWEGFIPGAKFTVAFDKDGNGMSMTSTVSGTAPGAELPDPKTVKGAYSWVNPMLLVVVESKEVEDFYEMAAGFVNRTGTLMVLIAEDGEAVYFEKE